MTDSYSELEHQSDLWRDRVIGVIAVLVSCLTGFLFGFLVLGAS